MTLIQALEQEVSSAIQSSGRKYFRSGAVQPISVEKDVIQTVVEGSKPYRVWIELGGRNQISFYCSCPYFESHFDVCKHVWATFLAAEDDNLLPDWRGRRTLNLLPADTESLEDEDDDEDFDLFDEYDEDDDNLFEDEQVSEDSRSYSPSAKNALRKQQAVEMKRYWQQRQVDGLRAAIAKVAPDSEPKLPAWKRHFENLRRQPPLREQSADWPPGKEILYVLQTASRNDYQDLAIEIETRARKKNGQWCKPRAHAVGYQTLHLLPDPSDRQILKLLIGTPRYSSYADSGNLFYPSSRALCELLPLMCATGRCFLRRIDSLFELQPFDWDAGEPWHFQVNVRSEKSGYSLSGALRRGEEFIGLEELAALFKSGFFLLRGRMARLDDGGAFNWIELLRRQRHIEVPARDRDALLQELLRLPLLPALELPEELHFEEIRAPGRPQLKFRRSPNSWQRGLLHADLAFEYAGFRISQTDPALAFADPPTRRRILRDKKDTKDRC